MLPIGNSVGNLLSHGIGTTLGLADKEGGMVPRFLLGELLGWESDVISSVVKGNSVGLSRNGKVGDSVSLDWTDDAKVDSCVGTRVGGFKEALGASVGEGG